MNPDSSISKNESKFDILRIMNFEFHILLIEKNRQNDKKRFSIYNFVKIRENS